MLRRLINQRGQHHIFRHVLWAHQPGKAAVFRCTALLGGVATQSMLIMAEATLRPPLPAAQRSIC